MELVAAHGCFGGVQKFYRHDSRLVGLPMRFSIFLPPPRERAGERVPC
jgi:S-formylglutathione hydrolase